MTKADMNINKNKQRLVYFSAFAIPVAMFMLLCAYNDAIPFGDSGFLERDMLSQYIKYFSYLQSIASGENDLFYTYSKALGGDMTGLWAYYLLSPLNIVFLFVPKAVFPTAVTFVIAVKLGLCGLTMAVLLSKIHKPCAGVLVFSCSYAFMSYNIVYFINIMWLDVVYMLPLVVIGLERILSGKGIALYTLSLACALVFNYYIAYMMCIFIALFFVFRMCGISDGSREKTGRLVLNFATASLLAGAMAAFALVPTALSLSGTKANFDTAKLSMYPMYTLSQHLSKLVCAAVPTGLIPGDLVMSDLPHIYCGAVVYAFVLMFFFIREIRPSVRIAAAALFAILFLSFNYNGSYVVWHAFNYPALFPYRNAFIVSFLMIWLAWQGYIHMEHINKRVIVCALLLAIIAVLIINPFKNLMVSRKMLVLDMSVILLSVCIVVLMIKKPRAERLCALVLVFAQLMLLGVNAQAHLRGNVSASAYRSNVEEKQQRVDKIKSRDDGFYRMALIHPDHNSGMQFAYNGFDHFSSTEKSNTKEFAIHFGLRHFLDVWVNYTAGATSSADAFLGIKYIMGDIPEQKQYVKISRDGEAAAYHNENALDLAMLAGAGTLDCDLEQDDIFTWQEQVFSAALGRDAGIFHPVENLSYEVYNMTEAPFADHAIKYEKIDQEEECGIKYCFTVTEQLPLYVYTSMPYVEADVSGRIFLNGVDKGAYMGSFDWQAVYLGTFMPGDEIEFVIKPNSHFYLQNNTYFAYEDQTALAEACAEINSRSKDASLEKIKNSHLRWEGAVSEENRVLLFTVPHDKGWRAEVDGQPAEIVTALDTLIALELEPGEHIVELRFTPPGLYAGLAISASALLLFILLIKRKKI